MCNPIKLNKHLRNVRISGQIASEPQNLPEMDLLELERNAYERGRAESENKFKTMIAAAQTLQGKLLDNLQKAENELAQTVENALPDLVIEGIRRIIPRWSPAAVDVQMIVRGMLSGLAAESGRLEIRLNAEDKLQLEQLQSEEGGNFEQATLVADRNLCRGECVVAGRFGIVDGRFESKLNRLRKDLH